MHPQPQTQPHPPRPHPEHAMNANPNDTREELAAPSAYRQRLIGMVGDRAPLDVLAATPTQLHAITRAHSADALRRRPASSRWSPLEVIGHMLDVEWTVGWRIRTIYCDDHPTIMGMDQDRWVDTQRHQQRDPADIVDDFAALRSINLKLWRTIPVDAMHRTGRHAERGEESLALMLPLQAGHDLTHLAQINRLLSTR